MPAVALCAFDALLLSLSLGRRFTDAPIAYVASWLGLRRASEEGLRRTELAPAAAAPYASTPPYASALCRPLEKVSEGRRPEDGLAA